MDANSIPVQIVDKKKQPLELLRVKEENESDNYLWVKNYFKAENENHAHIAKRFEEELRGIQNGIVSNGGTKRCKKAWERIVRLEEKSPSVHQYYEIKVTDNGKGTATALSFKKKDGMLYDEKSMIR